jgi:hypothetical protein
MKTLDFEQMKVVKGSGCFEGAAGGLGLALSSGLITFGPWALVGAMAIGCIGSEMSDSGWF